MNMDIFLNYDFRTRYISVRCIYLQYKHVYDYKYMSINISSVETVSSETVVLRNLGIAFLVFLFTLFFVTSLRMDLDCKTRFTKGSPLIGHFGFEFVNDLPTRVIHANFINFVLELFLRGYDL